MSQWVSLVQDIAKALSVGSHGYEVRWLVVGSVASVLQGCNLEPNDIDLIFPDYTSLETATEKLAAVGLLSVRDDIHTEAYGPSFRWHISRSETPGGKIDLVFIEDGGGIPDSDSGDGIWEGGQLIWQRHNLIQSGDYMIPVAPLLVQFESQIRRDMPEKAAEIRRVIMRNGFNIKEFEESLAAMSKAKFGEL